MKKIFFSLALVLMFCGNLLAEQIEYFDSTFYNPAIGDTGHFRFVSDANPLPVNASIDTVTVDASGMATETKQDSIINAINDTAEISVVDLYSNHIDTNISITAAPKLCDLGDTYNIITPDDPDTVTHKWSEKGSYDIKVLAIDSYAEWAEETTSVTVLKSKNTPYSGPLMQFLNNLLEKFPNLFPILKQMINLVN